MSKEIREQIDRIRNWKPILKESIDSGSFILYHRTSKNPLDFNKGYKVGEWSGKYGSGLYSFIDLSNATNDTFRDLGDYIVEISVQNNGKFLILDPQLLKKVYGGNISLIGQLKKIFGGKFTKFYAQNKQKIDELNNLNLEEEYAGNSSNILQNLVFHCKGFFQGCDGVTVIDSNFGAIFILYETDLMNPLRYSTDEGKTWTSIKNKTSFNIGKDDRNKEDKLSVQKYSGFDDKGFEYKDN